MAGVGAERAMWAVPVWAVRVVVVGRISSRLITPSLQVNRSHMRLVVERVPAMRFWVPGKVHTGPLPTLAVLCLAREAGRVVIRGDLAVRRPVVTRRRAMAA